QDRSISDRVQGELGAMFNIDQHKVIVTHLYAYYEDGHLPDISMFINRLKDEKLQQLVIEIAMTPIFDNIGEEEINDYTRTIRAQANDIASIDAYREQQRIAEQQKDPIRAAQIAMQIIELQKQMKQSNQIEIMFGRRG